MSLINSSIQPADIKGPDNIWFGTIQFKLLKDSEVTPADTLCIKSIIRLMQKIGVWVPFRCGDLQSSGKYDNTMAARLRDLASKGILNKISKGLFEVTDRGKEIMFYYWPVK